MEVPAGSRHQPQQVEYAGVNCGRKNLEADKAKLVDALGSKRASLGAPSEYVEPYSQLEVLIRR